MADPLRIYISSVSSNLGMKKQQERIKTVLDGKRVSYEVVDIAVNEEDKLRMRELCDDPTALPPRLFKGERYLGDYGAFDDAVEMGTLTEFLQL